MLLQTVVFYTYLEQTSVENQCKTEKIGKMFNAQLWVFAWISVSELFGLVLQRQTF